ncbi:MAG: hypothetical protein ABSC21_23205, partial [Terriglobia bacterium]
MMFADKTRVLINFPTAWAQTDFDVKGVSQAQSGRGGEKGCSPLWPCMPVDSATAYVRNGIPSEAHA